MSCHNPSWPPVSRPRPDIASPVPEFDQIVAHTQLDLVSSAELRQMTDASYAVPHWWRVP